VSGAGATTIVVNDASCLIDLRKGRLLHVLLKLPYSFVIPYPVRHSELLDFSPQEWALLDGGGMETLDLPAERVSEVFAIKASYPKLSANDCFCLVATRCFEGAILLTGDGLLRRAASEDGLRVHGVLWIIDELKRTALCGDTVLVAALKTWGEDASVFLPEAEIERRLRLLKRG
jgi:predicted nucleic acid-binding protein